MGPPSPPVSALETKKPRRNAKPEYHEHVERDDGSVQRAYGTGRGHSYLSFSPTSSAGKSMAEPSRFSFTTVSIASRAASGTVIRSLPSRFTTFTLEPPDSDADLISRAMSGSSIGSFFQSKMCR